ncbi:MAG: RimK family alpha-L-glutamate ligase [Aestuariibacter sp.]
MTNKSNHVVAVLGNQDDFHAKHILQTLSERGIESFLLDSQQFSQCFTLSWDPERKFGVVAPNSGVELPFSAIDAVYWRSIDVPSVSESIGKKQQLIARHDSYSLLNTLLYEPGINWVNSYQAYQFHKVKPRQLSLASTLGAKIPKTIISNRSADIIDFSRQVPKAIFKPVQGGAHTEVLTEDLLQPERLSFALEFSPVTIQEYIEGTNIRTYVIGEQVYSAVIDSEKVDFRSDDEALLLAIATPEKIALMSRRICQQFGMQWTAIDWRRTAEGQYYFLEANPSPMFYFFELQTGYPITEKLVDLLLQ